MKSFFGFREAESKQEQEAILNFAPQSYLFSDWTSNVNNQREPGTQQEKVGGAGWGGKGETTNIKLKKLKDFRRPVCNGKGGPLWRIITVLFLACLTISGYFRLIYLLFSVPLNN